ncbi:hypothetical protein AAMO2058_000711400 [Amorphochlora amoebiformis]
MQSSSIGFWWMFAISFGIWGSDTVAGSRIELQGAANYSVLKPLDDENCFNSHAQLSKEGESYSTESFCLKAAKELKEEYDNSAEFKQECDNKFGKTCRLVCLSLAGFYDSIMFEGNTFKMGRPKYFKLDHTHCMRCLTVDECSLPSEILPGGYEGSRVGEKSTPEGQGQPNINGIQPEEVELQQEVEAKKKEKEKK